MTPFPDYASTVPSSVGWSHCVRQWSLGGNDKYGDCAFVAPCNLIDLVKAVSGKHEVVGEAEAEFFYRVEAGFNPLNEATDKGETLQKVLQYWCDHGWPADPTYKPEEMWSVTKPQISSAIYALGALPAWCMLPSRDDDPDFSDGAIDMGLAAAYAHAVLLSDATPETITLITWAEKRVVSRRWWDIYGREQFGLLLPDWHLPIGENRLTIP